VNDRLRIEGLTKLSDKAQGAQEELASRKLAKEKFSAHWSEPTKNAWKLKGRDAVYTKHVYRYGVVAKHHRSAIAGTPPMALLAKSDLKIADVYSEVGVKQLNLVY
jgi:hypothetical protein